MQGRKDEDILNRLRETFRIEAAEHLQAMFSGLLELEKDVDSNQSAQLIEEIFRRAHSLKGAARAVNYSEVEAICQSLETVFSAWQRGDAQPQPDQFDHLHQALTAIESLVGSAAKSEPPPAPKAPSPAISTIQVPEPEPPSPTVSEGPLTVRIPTAKLDLLLLEAEEMLAVKVNLSRSTESLRELHQEFEAWKDKWRVATPYVSDLRRSASGDRSQSEVVSFLDWNLNAMRVIDEKLRAATSSAAQDQQLVARRVDELLEDSKQLLLLPLTTLLDLFPKIVREMGKDQGKEVALVIQGGEIEVDKRIIEQMKDPLIHLIRNCVDHGIEKPEARLSEGKPRQGTITLAVSRTSANEIELRVSDDGIGIRADRVRHAASGTGGYHELDPFELIFRSGVSTSPIITEISGRGLGLAIVHEAVTRLGGHIGVESEPGSGTTFRIGLPTLLATFRGIQVRAAGRSFLLPTANVDRVGRVKSADVKTVENRETITVSGKTVALVWLDSVLDLPRTAQTVPNWLSVAVLSWRGERIAFVIDEVLHEEEVLVKSIAKPLSKIRHISGASTFGSTRVVPVLDVPQLIETAKKTGSGPRESAPAERQATTRRRILVAEDSITSRMLLKTILESAGHEVVTAVDGMAALTELRSSHFDLVISDVEMPRMNGFELTSQIRFDKKLADKPVILVTALSSREDRERGIEVGASAYIVKSNFDQSNLLEAVDRLL